MKLNKVVAFALGGLSGNNAHGAGFLQAAMETGIEPVIISFSSGQIPWVWRYLQEKNQRMHSPDLRKHLEEDIKKMVPTGNYDLDTALLLLHGISGVFRPAFREFAEDFARNGAYFLKSIVEQGPRTFFAKELLESVPGRLLVPEIPEIFFEIISKTFNDEREIGLAFNSFDPIEGNEMVYLNDAARNREAACRSRYRLRTDYCEITPEGVKDALKIYQYGFDCECGHLDGAYYRQIMLSELAAATDIFVARPINHRWVGGSLPTNFAGIEDLKTKVGFNGSYAGERDKINLINKLVADGSLAWPYKKINLVEIEIEIKRGYFDYIYESLDVFDLAFKRAGVEFRNFMDRQKDTHIGIAAKI